MDGRKEPTHRQDSSQPEQTKNPLHLGSDSKRGQKGGPGGEKTAAARTGNRPKKAGKAKIGPRKFTKVNKNADPGPRRAKAVTFVPKAGNNLLGQTQRTAVKERKLQNATNSATEGDLLKKKKYQVPVNHLSKTMPGNSAAWERRQQRAQGGHRKKTLTWSTKEGWTRKKITDK